MECSEGVLKLLKILVKSQSSELIILVGRLKGNVPDQSIWINKNIAKALKQKNILIRLLSQSEVGDNFIKMTSRLKLIV